MKDTNKISSIFLLTIFALMGLSCAKQSAQVDANNNNNNSSVVVSSGELAKSPTESYKMLFAAVKAKDSERIKQLMSKNSLGLAEFNANNQKITLEKSLENGLVAPAISPTITEIRDERVKGNYGAIEVFNSKDNRWEDLPFILEDGGWKLAVGDIFQDKYESPGKSQSQIENDATNKSMSMPMNKMTNMMPANKDIKTIPEMPANGTKSVEVPKETKPKP